MLNDPEPSTIDALRRFCRDAAATSVAAHVDSLRPGGRVLRFEPDLAQQTLLGLMERFGVRDARDLWPHLNAWAPLLEEIFGTVERLTQPGARRALFASIARLLAPGLPRDCAAALGPIVCAAVDIEKPKAIECSACADAAVVSFRHAGRSVAVVELPVFAETTLGEALATASGKRLRRLWAAAHAPDSRVDVASALLRGGLREMRSLPSLLTGRKRTPRFVGMIRAVYDETLKSVKTPVFAPGAASAQDVAGRLIAPAQPTAVAPHGTKASSDVRTQQVPVLMYHRILPAGETLEDPFSTTLDHFERQLDYLQQMNCYTVASSTLSQALRAGESLPGRPVLITFDDGYVDFATLAWPALRRRNFIAEVFLVTELVGRTSEWDSRIAKPAPLMSWPQIRALHDEGVAFGSHFATHTPVTHLSSDDLLREAAMSRAAIEREVDAPATSVALPFGLYDDRVAPMLEWSGYSCGFSTKPGLAGPDCDLLRLPRLNAGGEMGIERFRKLLPWPDPAGADRSFQ